MNKFTAEKYIDAIFSRYIVSEKDAEKLRAGSDLLEKTFGEYYWSDIEHTLDWYYTHKNDKTRPTIAQIQNALQSLGIMQNNDSEPEKNDFTRPSTNLWSIKQTFNKLIDILIGGGVLPNEDGNYTNIRSIVNPDTDLPVLNPMQWLGWQLADAKNNRPDIFVPFPNATILEQLALAIQNNLIQFKIRDWSKLAQAKKGGNL